MIRAEMGRWGPKHDYRGAHVITVDGRLAEITEVYRRESPSATMAKLRRFNGENAGEHTLATLWILTRD